MEWPRNTIFIDEIKFMYVADVFTTQEGYYKKVITNRYSDLNTATKGCRVEIFDAKDWNPNDPYEGLVTVRAVHDAKKCTACVKKRIASLVSGEPKETWVTDLVALLYWHGKIDQVSARDLIVKVEEEAQKASQVLEAWGNERRGAFAEAVALTSVSENLAQADSYHLGEGCVVAKFYVDDKDCELGDSDWQAYYRTQKFPLSEEDKAILMQHLGGLHQEMKAIWNRLDALLSPYINDEKDRAGKVQLLMGTYIGGILKFPELIATPSPA